MKESLATHFPTNQVSMMYCKNRMTNMLAENKTDFFFQSFESRKIKLMSLPSSVPTPFPQ
jgi:hypothetical protein